MLILAECGLTGAARWRKRQDMHAARGGGTKRGGWGLAAALALTFLGCSQGEAERAPADARKTTIGNPTEQSQPNPTPSVKDPICLSRGHYTEELNGPTPCCAGLRRVPVSSASPMSSDQVCMPGLGYACISGSCGDGACEPGEDVACGCSKDCPFVAEWREASPPPSTCDADASTCATCSHEYVVKSDEQLRRRTSTCSEVSNETFACRCDTGSEEAVTVQSTEGCDIALNTACDVGEIERYICGTWAGSLCQPYSLRYVTFDCVCPDGRFFTDSVNDCSLAGFNLCADSCEAASGSCKPVGLESKWICDCDLYGEQHVEADHRGCEEVLRDTCEPGHGLDGWGDCNDERGHCRYVDEGAWNCGCLDGTVMGVTPDPERNLVNCGAALRAICGEAAPVVQP
jgi:hypothetical protein